MQDVEYKVICGWRAGNSLDSVNEELNDLAKEGWRVVSNGDESIILQRVLWTDKPLVATKAH